VTAGDSGPVTIMDEDHCWARLSATTLGRLAISVDGQPDIFPVNFVVQRRTVLIRTAEGTKLAGAAINERVAFEADDHDVSRGWSVVLKGRAQLLATTDELLAAERAQVLPWIATPKRRYLRILPDHISGRQFTFGGEFEGVYDFA
jgi:uncharacterized protein